MVTPKNCQCSSQGQGHKTWPWGQSQGLATSLIYMHLNEFIYQLEINTHHPRSNAILAGTLSDFNEILCRW